MTLRSDTFTNEDNISYYLLGAYMTDGSVSTKPRCKRVTITSADGDWISQNLMVFVFSKAIEEAMNLFMFSKLSWRKSNLLYIYYWSSN